MNKAILLLALIITVGSAHTSNAYLTQLGDGDYRAYLVINFDSGAIYEFEVNFSDLLWSGRDLLNFVEAETSLVSHQQSFDFGGGPIFFLDGLEFDGHSNIGFAGGDNWWHYWVRDGETGEWEMPMFGFSDRQLSDGSWDGWVYGNSNPPMLIPEPGTAILLGMGILMLGWVRRRRS